MTSPVHRLNEGRISGGWTATLELTTPFDEVNPTLICPSNIVSEAAPARREGPPATPETGMVAVPRGRLLYRRVVVERVGRVAGVVVIVADQRERVTMTRYDAGVDLCPGAGPDADLR